MGVPGPIEDIQPFAELSQGATTVVYKAYQRSLDRFVLLKLLRPAYSRDEDVVRRFEREAQLVARVQHANVVAVYAYGQAPEGAYLVAEFVEGMDLAGVLDHGALPWPLAAYVLREATRGLQAAHGREILHRDLKPSNIMVSHEGQVRLTDFGLATVFEDETEENLGSVRGTLAYLAPEQVQGHPPAPTADLFSLGATLYEMLAGRRAFSGSRPADYLDAVLHHDPLPYLDANPAIPEALRRMAGTLLAKDPADRYQTATALLADLEAFIERHAPRTAAADLAAYLADPDAYTPAAPPPEAPGAAPVEAVATDPATKTAAAPPPSSSSPRRRYTLGLVVLLAAALGLVSLAVLSGSADEAAPREPNAVPTMPAADSLSALPDTAALPITGIEEMPTGPPTTQEDDDALEETSPPLAAEPAILRPLAPDSAATAVPNDPAAPSRPGTLRIDARPWAAVYIDGDSVGMTPLVNPPVQRPAGTYQVELRNPQFPVYRQKVTLAAGGSEHIQASLWGLVGRLNVEVTPWAEVLVDGVVRDTIPPQDRPLIIKPGRHRLTLRHPAYGDRDTTFTIAAGEERTLRFRLSRRR